MAPAHDPTKYESALTKVTMALYRAMPGAPEPVLLDNLGRHALGIPQWGFCEAIATHLVDLNRRLTALEAEIGKTHADGAAEDDPDFADMVRNNEMLRDHRLSPREAEAEARTAQISRLNRHLREAEALNADLLAALKHLVRWHDQLSAKDIARAQAVIDRAAEGR
jgi:hypothetical protein